ncbi:PDZ domain-containing protein [Virgibacillus sp. 179-BFC.A HS]|uniref:PDZ domain-containing protein n=1 Tax=Tigheibacillus jepli TaxID=3035914 RepID=A0ABU5CFK1_9BACI|nr:PDZ domain-containing protein [Virgibacillus sp. 179-BFC.A HS]MDY0405107.1 PDZ domain-containing protein [Virgibacillus sp. 179-BFC.A HS]
MLRNWLLEIAAGFGRMFVNPLLYWTFLLLVITGVRRIKRERMFFGTKIKAVFSEWHHTWGISLLFGLVMSLVAVGIGIVFTPQMLLLISVVTILLSIHGKFTWLSPVYTIGISYLLLLFLPEILHRQSFINTDLFAHVNFSGLAIVLGFLLVAQAALLYGIKRKDVFSSLRKSSRGAWIGVQHLKKLAVIPFFIPIPLGWIHSFADFWPYIPLGDMTSSDSFGLLLFPMVIGFHFQAAGNESQVVKRWLGRRILLLAVIVLAVGIGSIYIGWLSAVAILGGILGWEYIHYRLRTKDQLQPAYFSQTDSGLRVLSVMPGSPSDKWGIYPGSHYKGAWSACSQ